MHPATLPASACCTVHFGGAEGSTHGVLSTACTLAVGDHGVGTTTLDDAIAMATSGSRRAGRCFIEGVGADRSSKPAGAVMPQRAAVVLVGIGPIVRAL